MDENAINYCLPLANTCREKGFKTEIYPSASKLKKQLDYANSKNIKWAVIVGESEIEKSEVSLKNLIDGKQQTIDIDSFVNFIY
jgi:histidyl-tRNA synthetase